MLVLVAGRTPAILSRAFVFLAVCRSILHSKGPDHVRPECNTPPSPRAPSLLDSVVTRSLRSLTRSPSRRTLAPSRHRSRPLRSPAAGFESCALLPLISVNPQHIAVFYFAIHPVQSAEPNRHRRSNVSGFAPDSPRPPRIESNSLLQYENHVHGLRMVLYAVVGIQIQLANR